MQRELWEVVHFESVDEAERGLATFFADYNHRRAHLGIGSLVPADRFYSRWPEVIAEMVATRLLVLSAVPVRRRAVQDELVCAFDRAHSAHGVTAREFCSALALSERTFGSISA